MASLAGLRAGDRIEDFGGPIARVADLVRATRRCRGATSLSFRRGARLERRVLPYIPFPDEEVHPDAELIYGDLGGIRTILVAPERADTVVVFLPGIDYASVDYALREFVPSARFLRDLNARGLATFRIERPGLGDSRALGEEVSAEDDLFEECEGFSDEQHVYRKGLESVRGRFARVVLFGHSVGGMHAVLLTDLADAAILYGSSAWRWSRCLREGRIRQLRLRGAPEAAVRATFPPELHGRSERFHAELDSLDLQARWDGASVPRALVIGGLDWVVSEEEQRAIGGEVLAIDGLDHAFTVHPSLEASLARFGRGTYEPRVADECAAWIERSVTDRKG